MLNTYQQCPYKFWLQHILQLAPIKKSQETVPANEWGSTLHEILNIFNKALIKDPTTKTRSATVLTTIANKLFSKKPSTFFWNMKRELFFGCKNNSGLLDEIIEIYEKHIATDAN